MLDPRGQLLRAAVGVAGHLATTHIRADFDRLAGLVPAAVNPVPTAHGVAQLGACPAQVPVTKA